MNYIISFQLVPLFSDCAPKLPSKAGQDDDDAARLWEMSEKLTGLTAAK